MKRRPNTENQIPLDFPSSRVQKKLSITTESSNIIRLICSPKGSSKKSISFQDSENPLRFNANRARVEGKLIFSGLNESSLINSTSRNPEIVRFSPKTMGSPQPKGFLQSSLIKGSPQPKSYCRSPSSSMVSIASKRLRIGCISLCFKLTSLFKNKEGKLQRGAFDDLRIFVLTLPDYSEDVRQGFLKAHGVVEERTSALKFAFFQLKASEDENGNAISNILLLLSKKFRKTVDSDCLNEQIKLLILQNDIRSPALLHMLQQSEVSIQPADFGKKEEIKRLQSLLRLYASIELFCPLDIAFFRVKQSLNRKFMLGLQLISREVRHSRRLNACRRLKHAIISNFSTSFDHFVKSVRKSKAFESVHYSPGTFLAINGVVKTRLRLAFGALLSTRKRANVDIFYQMAYHYGIQTKDCFIRLREFLSSPCIQPRDSREGYSSLYPNALTSHRETPIVSVFNSFAKINSSNFDAPGFTSQETNCQIPGRVSQASLFTSLVGPIHQLQPDGAQSSRLQGQKSPFASPRTALILLGILNSVFASKRAEHAREFIRGLKDRSAGRRTLLIAAECIGRRISRLKKKRLREGWAKIKQANLLLKVIPVTDFTTQFELETSSFIKGFSTPLVAMHKTRSTIPSPISSIFDHEKRRATHCSSVKQVSSPTEGPERPLSFIYKPTTSHQFSNDKSREDLLKISNFLQFEKTPPRTSVLPAHSASRKSFVKADLPSFYYH